MEMTPAPLPDWLGPDTPELRAKLQAFVDGFYRHDMVRDAVAAEREACADLAEQMLPDGDPADMTRWLERDRAFAIAAAIRNRT